MNNLNLLSLVSESKVSYISEVYETLNYDQFSFLPGNRNGCEKNSIEAKNLKLNPKCNNELIKRRNDWMKLFINNDGMDLFSPIKVAFVMFNDEVKLTILDGQGRRAAISKIAENGGKKYTLFFQIIFPNKILTIGEAQQYVISINSQSNEWNSRNKRDHYRVSEYTPSKIKNEMEFIDEISTYFDGGDSNIDNIWFGQGSTKKERYFCKDLEERETWKCIYYKNDILRIANNEIDWFSKCDSQDKRSLYSIYKYRDILLNNLIKSRDEFKNVQYMKNGLNNNITIVKSPTFVFQLKEIIFKYEKLSNIEHDHLLKYIADNFVKSFSCNKSTSLEIRESLYNVIKNITKEGKQPGVNMSNIKAYMEWFKNNITKKETDINLNFDAGITETI